MNNEILQTMAKIDEYLVDPANYKPNRIELADLIHWNRVRGAILENENIGG